MALVKKSLHVAAWSSVLKENLGASHLDVFVVGHFVEFCVSLLKCCLEKVEMWCIIVMVL